MMAFEFPKMFVDQNISYIVSYFLAMSGIRTTISAIGFVYIKRSQDPLVGIRHFECMDLISSVQKTPAKFIPKVAESAHWS